MSDSIQIPRSLLDSPNYLKGEFDEIRAKIDLMLLASSQPCTVELNGNSFNCKVGQFATTLSILQSRWGWGIKRVRRLLNLWEDEQFILKETSKRGTLITILDYPKGAEVNISESDSYDFEGQSENDNDIDIVELVVSSIIEGVDWAQSGYPFINAANQK